MDGSQLEQGTQLAGKTAGMIADYGMLVMVGSLFLIAAGVAIWLVARYWSRKLNGEYIKNTEVIDWVKKNKPEILIPDISVLPHLKDHRFFNESSRQMRLAESSKSKLERDLAVWTIRGYRDIFADIVESAYEDKAGFDASIGDAAKFRARVDAALVDAAAAIRYRLVEEFGFPADVYSGWQQSREASDELMTNMLDVAASRLSPYDRLQCALDSQYARVLMMRKAISEYVSNVDNVDNEDIENYQPPTEAGANTFQAIPVSQLQRGSYPAAIFEKRRKN